MSYPLHRLRRLRRTESIRSLVRETRLGVDDLVYPLFASHEESLDSEIPALPGVKLLAGGPLQEEARRASDLGIKAVLLFGVPADQDKDARATAAVAGDGVAQRAVRQIKEAAPEMTVIADLCLCEYTSDGHCGLMHDGEIDNDRTLEVLQQAALSLAEAGADVIAPSGMMDGVTLSLRSALDEAGHRNVLTMPYSAKFNSCLYGPFKEATNSSPAESRHMTHQLDIANGDQALRELRLDIDEGADWVIVKPALTSLDIISRARQELDIPIAAYNVSGVYAMLLASAKGDAALRQRLMMEVLTCIKRAGADMIITYFAKEAAQLLRV